MNPLRKKSVIYAMKAKKERGIRVFLSLITIICVILCIGINCIYSEDIKPALKKGLGNICLGCHDRLKKELSKGKAHKPVKMGDCISCHTPHAAKDENLLFKPGYVFCSNCHDSTAIGMNNKIKHEPVEFMECGVCHKPHVSEHKNLLVKKGEGLCFICHEDSGYRKAYIHNPVSKGRCNICHKTHSADSGYLLIKSTPDLCSGCHKILKGHTEIDTKNSNCSQCHNPHSSERKNLLHNVDHAPYKDGTCEKCHQKKSGIIARTIGNSELCYKCHQDSMKKFEERERSHIVKGPDECTLCHNPHGSQRKDLVRRKDGPLCISCHYEIKVKLKTESGVYRHKEVTARRCSTCHDAHSSNDPKYIKANIVTICLSCHQRQKVFCHPIGEKAIDPRNQTPINCLTCHNPMSASYPQLMRLDGQDALCKQCHKNY